MMFDLQTNPEVLQRAEAVTTASDWERGMTPVLQHLIEKERDNLERANTADVAGIQATIRTLRRVMSIGTEIRETLAQISGSKQKR